MTVVALLNFDKVPVLIADAMISVEQLGNSIQIPTLGDTNRLGLPFSIVDLRRKLIRVNKNCVLGFSGTVKFANEFIAELVSASSHSGVITQEILESVYYDFDEEARKEVGIVGFSLDPKSMDGYWLSVNAIPIEIPYFEKCLVAGSGAEPFVKWLAAFGSEIDATNVGHPNPFERAIEQAYSIVGRLVHLDSLRISKQAIPPSIGKAYGGWYEAAYYGNMSFESADELLFFDLACQQGSESIQLTRCYLNNLPNEVNEVLSAAFEAPVAGEVSGEELIFRIPARDFSQYLIEQEGHELVSIASLDALKLAVEKVDNAICTLQLSHEWTEETLRHHMPDDPRWEVLGEKGTAIQRFLEFQLRQRQGSAPFRAEISNDHLALRVSREWLAKKLAGLVSKRGILVDRYD